MSRQVLGNWLITFILLFTTTSLWAEGLTADVLINLKQVRSSAVSPDGKHIAYSVRVPQPNDAKASTAKIELWISTIDGKNQRLFVGNPLSVGAFSWSVDGKHIHFLSKISSYNAFTQVFAIPVDGGAPQLVTKHSSSISQFSQSPDGRYIAYIAKDVDSHEEKQAKEAGRDWKIADTNYKFPRIYILDTTTGKSNLFVSQDMAITQMAWSPNSKTIVFQAAEAPTVDVEMMFSKIYRMNIGDDQPVVLCETNGKLGSMAFSPDGQKVAFAGAVDISDPLAQSLFVVDAAGGEAKNYMPEFEGSLSQFAWSNNEKIMMLSTEFSINTLREVSIKDGKMKLLHKGLPTITDFSLHVKSQMYSAVAHTPEHPAELFNGKKNVLKRLTFHNPELSNIKLAKQEVVSWKGPDNLTIEGVLTYPLNYVEGNRYPLALQIHGGPEGVSLHGWNTRAGYPVQILAANGYAVLEPNYRGSGGRGVAFAKADHNDLGGKEFEDVLAGIDHLVEKGLVDNDKIVTGGWSYGGYFSAWAATKHTERFKASVVAAGLTNWISFTGTTDIPYEMSLVHWNSWWYDEPQQHWERSPLAHINQAKTPTLIVHGEKDDRVHIEQSLQMYQMLRIKNVPAKLVLYPREPHGLREHANEAHFINTVIEWFDMHVKSDNERKEGSVNKDIM